MEIKILDYFETGKNYKPEKDLIECIALRDFCKVEHIKYFEDRKCLFIFKHKAGFYWRNKRIAEKDFHKYKEWWVFKEKECLQKPNIRIYFKRKSMSAVIYFNSLQELQDYMLYYGEIDIESRMKTNIN